MSADNVTLTGVVFDEETKTWYAHVVKWKRLNFLERVCERVWGDKDDEYPIESIWMMINRPPHPIGHIIDWKDVDTGNRDLDPGIRGQAWKLIEEQKRAKHETKMAELESQREELITDIVNLYQDVHGIPIATSGSVLTSDVYELVTRRYR